jgi:septum formation protein
MRIVLASGSPRRHRLLAEMGLRFEVVASDVDETRFPDEDPDHYVERLARTKAEWAAQPGVCSIGADTTVVHRGVVMGKPAHPNEAISMLRRLAGGSHTVHTGVAVAWFGDEPSAMVHSTVVRTVVTFSDLTDQEIAAYVATGEPLDKAGAYALQGLGGVFVTSVEGSPSNVVGLPVHALAALLRSAGIDVINDRRGTINDER